MIGKAARSSEEVPLSLAAIRNDIACLRRDISQVINPGVSVGIAVFPHTDERNIRDESEADYEDAIICKRSRLSKAPLPDPRLIKRILEIRRIRGSFFDGRLFADPAWDMILDLTVARANYRQISVTSLCIASGVPPTTALRWINILVGKGIFQRFNDDRDKRRAYISLSDDAADKVAEFFQSCGRDTGWIV